MEKYLLNIWNRKFELDVIYECYPGEEILETQKEVKQFINDGKIFDNILEDVKEYITKTATEPIEASIEDIFKYITPKNIFVQHNENYCKFGLICDYKFNLEHGVAIVFENDKCKEIGTQDIIL